MEKPSLIVRFFSILLRILVVLVLMVVIAVASFEGVTYYLTGSLYDLRDRVRMNSISCWKRRNFSSLSSAPLDLDS